MSQQDDNFTFKDSISLKYHMEMRFKEMDKALTLARDSMEKRLDSMNEFRETLRDQASKFVTRAELVAKLEAIERGKRDNIAIVIAVISMLISISFLILMLIK